jgi:branched-chain amino acid transport system ATP-binding protein
MTVALLELHGVEVVYHHVAIAIQGVSLTVPQRGTTAVIGTNGAGKTTTLKAISGFLGAEDARVTDGRIVFDGQDITGWPPHRTAQLGIALVPERDKVFDTLSVDDNLQSTLRPRRVSHTAAFDYFPRLADLRDRRAGLLSGGEKQMLGVAMALLSQPRLLLVDELSLGLSPVAVRQVLERLVELSRDVGFALLLVEQNVATALRVAHQGYVMEDGRIVFSGSAERLSAHGDIREFYLGSPGDSDVRSYRDVKQYRRKRRWWG